MSSSSGQRAADPPAPSTTSPATGPPATATSPAAACAPGGDSRSTRCGHLRDAEQLVDAGARGAALLGKAAYQLADEERRACHSAAIRCLTTTRMRERRQQLVRERRGLTD
jgi:hypothetical protein